MGASPACILSTVCFRLPIVLKQPAGVATDIATNLAMFTGVKMASLADANAAAGTVFIDAEALHDPLLTAGQSQAGGEAQLQAAYIEATHPHRSILTGFVSLNAAPPEAAIRRLGLAPKTINGVNFVKDLDPGFGPYGVLPNEIGLQIYIHPNGTGSLTPGKASFFSALRHPRQHLLEEFNNVSLARALTAAPDHCSPAD